MFRLDMSEAMETRLQAMLEAVRTVRAPLDRLYQSSNDEQKARFNAVVPSNAIADKKERRDFARLCTKRGTEVAGLPIVRIGHAVQPTGEQQIAFAELRSAATKASERLKANCPTYESTHSDRARRSDGEATGSPDRGGQDGAARAREFLRQPERRAKSALQHAWFDRESSLEHDPEKWIPVFGQR